VTTDIRTASLVDMLTGLVAEDADAVALAQALDTEIQALATLAEQCAFFSRIADLTEEQCDEAARWFKLVELEGWGLAGVERKRAALLEMVNVYRRRGTRWAWKRVAEILETPVTVDGEERSRDGMYSLIEWWEDDPAADPHTYRVDALIEWVGLTLAEIRHMIQVCTAYVPTRERLREFSETLELESDLLLACYPEVGLHIEVY